MFKMWKIKKDRNKMTKEEIVAKLVNINKDINVLETNELKNIMVAYKTMCHYKSITDNVSVSKEAFNLVKNALYEKKQELEKQLKELL